MAQEFVQGWYMLDILGEGRFGEVRLVMNKESHEMVAAKIIKVTTEEEAMAVKKELAVHKQLNHENVIGLYGNRRCDDVELIFLEYASGGELFDRIEPDKGIHPSTTHRFFHELITGIEYLHSRGIVHRDIKPENLLLDSNDTLKIADFGFATIFRHQGTTRKLEHRCGSIHYMAPEVLSGDKHLAEPIDIWSCGIVLFAMITGELPWDEASPELCVPYRNWVHNKTPLHKIPWKKLKNDVFSLIKNILCPYPTKRYKISDIRKNKWFLTEPKNSNVEQENIHSGETKRRCTGFLSQPTLGEPDVTAENASPLKMMSSQPLNVDDMILCSQSQAGGNHSQMHSQTDNTNTQPATRLYLKLVRRLTRFWTKLNFDCTITMLTQTFEQIDELTYKQTRESFTISMKDRRRRPLVFRASVNQMNHDKVLVDFRLAKGDGLEFKRQFTKIKERMDPYIEPDSVKLML